MLYPRVSSCAKIGARTATYGPNPSLAHALSCGCSNDCARWACLGRDPPRWTTSAWVRVRRAPAGALCPNTKWSGLRVQGSACPPANRAPNRDTPPTHRASPWRGRLHLRALRCHPLSCPGEPGPQVPGPSFPGSSRAVQPRRGSDTQPKLATATCTAASREAHRPSDSQRCGPHGRWPHRPPTLISLRCMQLIVGDGTSAKPHRCQNGSRTIPGQYQGSTRAERQNMGSSRAVPGQRHSSNIVCSAGKVPAQCH